MQLKITALQAPVLKAGVLIEPGEQPHYTDSLPAGSSERVINCGDCSRSLFLAVADKTEADTEAKIDCPVCGRALTIRL